MTENLNRTFLNLIFFITDRKKNSLKIERKCYIIHNFYSTTSHVTSNSIIKFLNFE